MEVSVRFKRTILLLFAASFLLPLIQATDFKYCDKGADYAVKVQDIEISPNPVVAGQPATFNLSASTGESISGGRLVIQVSYVGIHVRTEKHNLCEETSCPISAGDFVISHTQNLPGFTPPGSYTLKMKMEGKNSEELTCIAFNFKIGFGSLLSDS
ncbi:uncharacterized protein LOC131148566 [Malania oleifera]|uniref:uncharacterized protein LOC131148566 n=1 Tax=Malania oleifera TaxID=397392 RepID=UPI0025ADA33D|nr:uncharacterized protein LOC131148566 [Malania oleifera]